MPENQLLASLTSKELKRIEPYLEPVSVEFNQHLLDYNRPIRYLWFPEDCVTATVVEAIDGATIEVGLMGSEGVGGLSLLFEERVSSATVLVQIPGTAMRIRPDVFAEHVLEKDGAFLKLLKRYANAFMAMISHHAACNTLHPVDERMCRWVLMTHDRVQRDQFPLTQEFPASMLGVRRPTLSPVASELKRQGLISYTRGSITVTDRKGLEARVCECYEIINNYMGRVFK